jgi:putative phosphoribosyl transferase
MITTVSRLNRFVEIPSGGQSLCGILHVPPGATGVVAFADSSGRGRFSPCNELAACALQKAGFCTLLLDLLDEDEAGEQDMVYDIELLARRLQSAADWLGEEYQTAGLRLGYFGAGTGAAAALVAAAGRSTVGAVVSRGGRPDLAGKHLPAVLAPTLLVVGGNDKFVVQLNQRALGILRCPKELIVVPGASHLFPESGAPEAVARLATEWFCRHLVPAKSESNRGAIETGYRAGAEQ